MKNQKKESIDPVSPEAIKTDNKTPNREKTKRGVEKMYKKISETEFRAAFAKDGCGDKFSPEAFDALYDYYVGLEAATGDPIELDVAEIWDTWKEYPNIEAVKAENAWVEDLDNLKAETDVIEIPIKTRWINDDVVYSGGGLLVKKS